MALVTWLMMGWFIMDGLCEHNPCVDIIYTIYMCVCIPPYSRPVTHLYEAEAEDAESGMSQRFIRKAQSEGCWGHMFIWVNFNDVTLGPQWKNCYCSKGDYPLVNIQKAIENGNFVSWFTHYKWWFSIVFCKRLPEGTFSNLISASWLVLLFAQI